MLFFKVILCCHLESSTNAAQDLMTTREMYVDNAFWHKESKTTEEIPVSTKRAEHQFTTKQRNVTLASSTGIVTSRRAEPGIASAVDNHDYGKVFETSIMFCLPTFYDKLLSTWTLCYHVAGTFPHYANHDPL